MILRMKKHTANAELTSTQLDRDGDDRDGDSPARQRAIRFCASQKMMLKQLQQRAASQLGGNHRKTTEAWRLVCRNLNIIHIFIISKHFFHIFINSLSLVFFSSSFAR